MPRRSVLFAPGDEPDKMKKAVRSAADVVVFDLEDGVHPDNRDEARDNVARILDGLRADCEVCVRLRPAEEGAREDVATVLSSARPDSVMLPKAESAKAVASLENITLPVYALIETAAGVVAAPEIAREEPTGALVFGAEDLAADLGANSTDAVPGVSYPRQRVLVAARAGDVDAIDTHYPQYEDLQGLDSEAREAAEMGYDGKLAINPRQVTPINQAFRPDDDRVEWARRILAANEELGQDGVFVVNGEMIDSPQIKRAERILARAGVDGY